MGCRYHKSKIDRPEKASTQSAPGGRYARVPDASYLHKRVCTIPLPAAGLCKIYDCEEGACGPEAVESVTACGLCSVIYCSAPDCLWDGRPTIKSVKTFPRLQDES